VLALEKPLRFGLVAVLGSLVPALASAQPAATGAPATTAAPAAEAPATEAAPAEPAPPEEPPTVDEEGGDAAPDAAYEDEGGPRPEDQFEPPFLGFYFSGGVGSMVTLQKRELCSEFAGCKDRGGFGVDFAVGARFSPMFKVQGAYDVTWHQGEAAGIQSVAILQSWRLDGRLTFPLEHNLEPFAQVGLGAYAYGDEFAVDAAGPGLQVGGGADLAFGRWWSLGATVLYRVFRLETLDFATGTLGPMNVHALTATLGLSFGPGI
jgi:hypothetical protein